MPKKYTYYTGDLKKFHTFQRVAKKFVRAKSNQDLWTLCLTLFDTKNAGNVDPDGLTHRKDCVAYAVGCLCLLWKCQNATRKRMGGETLAAMTPEWLLENRNGVVKTYREFASGYEAILKEQIQQTDHQAFLEFQDLTRKRLLKLPASAELDSLQNQFDRALDVRDLDLLNQALDIAENQHTGENPTGSVDQLSTRKERVSRG